MKYVSILIYLIILIYLAAVIGNFILLLLIWMDLRLHTPMYFLLSHHSLIDLALISGTVAKMTANFSLEGRASLVLAVEPSYFNFLHLGC